ncbi:PAS domain-containing protein [Ramlibacter montanisoli]|uniref:histidine kinase n=1 Tax=Ramlibacter montanisoli TaxID=2732512 RepID=A0A849K0F2_9BURK|nr:PAS domain-containing protein [Ramlibacter montanisoli]NNU42002.1 PAS domain S-box protein [Ramlibacter montanisoli]
MSPGAPALVLRADAEQLARLAGSISDYLWSAEAGPGQALAYRYFSPVVERITGRPREYYLAEGLQVWLATIEPQDRAAAAAGMERILGGEPDRLDLEYRIHRPDGTVRWVRDSMHATRLADGRMLLDGVVSDITERQQAAAALRESEELFRSLTELSSDWYWRQDENLRFTYLSSQAISLTGHTGESSVGKLRWELADMWPLSGSWDEHKAVLAARQPFRNLECCRIGVDGVARYLSMTGAPSSTSMDDSRATTASAATSRSRSASRRNCAHGARCWTSRRAPRAPPPSNGASGRRTGRPAGPRTSNRCWGPPAPTTAASTAG